jgi:hypothetical protein
VQLKFLDCVTVKPFAGLLAQLDCAVKTEGRTVGVWSPLNFDFSDFAFLKYLFKNSARGETEVFHDFPQFLQINIKLLLPVRLRKLPSVSFQVYYPLQSQNLEAVT